MDYKEKLRLAKDALASNSYDKKTIEYIFPELKESEDEKIREAIISALENTAISGYGNVSIEVMFAWLKKQGKQKPEIKYVYPKFRIGDVIEPKDPNGHFVPVRVQYIGEGYYQCESDDHKSFTSFPIRGEEEYKLVEQNPSWSEEDEMMFNSAIWHINNSVHNGLSGDSSTVSNWLKSLKDRMKGE